jgi:hypothetical protein
MFNSLQELTHFIADRVLDGDKSVVGRLPAYIDGYFDSIHHDANRCIDERDALATTFGDKVPLLRSELSERVFHLLARYSLGREAMAAIVGYANEETSHE